MDTAEDIVHDFLVESHENLDQLDRDLVTLEQDPESNATLSSVFRTIHTIKGTCGFLGFGKLESVAHAGENLLSKLRDGQLSLRPEMTTGLLSLVDAVREILARIENDGSEGDADYTALIETLISLQEARLARQCPDVAVAVPRTPIAPAAPIEANTPPPQTQPIPPITKDIEHAEISGATGGVSESTIRVDVGLLDKLMNRVGELVLARNQILQFTSTVSDASFLSTSQRLNLITTELQEGVMKTRMQPIGNIWAKFPRIVRDLSVQCGKRVRIEMEGNETELDKTIIEAIKDPLTHIIRNSVDHGIETPDIRETAGKSGEGVLRLRAFHEGGQVNIEISDDGAGLNLDRIRQKVVEKGVVSQDQSLRMNDRELAQLIFAPGFSTARNVTNISGRGVGMDVVKTNIEKIGGTVDVQSRSGHGTTIKIKIPLTLAIIPALIVTCGGDRYAIPQVSLLELVRLEGEQARQGIEMLHGAPVYRLRGQLLPIVHLNRELNIEPAAPQSSTDDAEEIVNIVVLRADDRQFGVVVDSINDTEEIVVKPLSKQLKSVPVYAGATIMGDGTVALILDVLGTAQRAHVVSESRDRNLADKTSLSSDNTKARQTLVILEVADRRLALPISLVSRLEEISPSEIERADDQEVVQYRGQIMPLLRIGQLLNLPTKDDDPTKALQVVVHTDGTKSVGLVVDRIADIVETDIESRRSTASDELLASAIVQHRVTDLLDLPAIIRRVDRMFFELPSDEGTAA